MKKILLAVWCSLMVAFTMNAQTSSGNEVVDEILKRDDVSTLEKGFAQKGIEAKVRIYFESKQNELIYSFRVFDADVYDVLDVDQLLSVFVIGTLEGCKTADGIGNWVVWISNEFKRTDTGIRMEILYGNQKKTASVTADEIIDIAYKMFQ